MKRITAILILIFCILQVANADTQIIVDALVDLDAKALKGYKPEDPESIFLKTLVNETIAACKTSKIRFDREGAKALETFIRSDEIKGNLKAPEYTKLTDIQKAQNRGKFIMLVISSAKGTGNIVNAKTIANALSARPRTEGFCPCWPWCR